MTRLMIAGLVLSFALPAHAMTVQCQGVSAQLPVTGPTVLSPVATEFIAANPQLGSQRGVLAPAFDELHSLENVLARLRSEGCTAAAAQAAAPVVHAAAAGYVKKTEFDNTPYRFNMTQNGKRMTADDFDAWMQANGYSAGRRIDPNAPQQPEAAQSTPQE